MSTTTKKWVLPAEVHPVARQSRHHFGAHGAQPRGSPLCAAFAHNGVGVPRAAGIDLNQKGISARRKGKKTCVSYKSQLKIQAVGLTILNRFVSGAEKALFTWALALLPQSVLEFVNRPNARDTKGRRLGVGLPFKA